MAQKSDSALVSDNNALESIITPDGLIDPAELKSFLRHVIDSKWSRVDNAGLSSGGSGSSPFVRKVTVQAVDEVSFKRNDSQSSVVLPNGNILCAYTSFYGLTTEDNGQSRVYARESADGGNTWINPRAIITTVNVDWNCQTPHLYVRSNGTVGLIFLAKSPSSEITKYYQMTSTDNGATWGTPVQILDAPTKYTIGAFDRVFKAKSGTWFLPLQENQDGQSNGNVGIYTGFYLFSNNEGVSWSEISRTSFSSPDGLVDEPGMYSVDRFIDATASDTEKLVYYWRSRSGVVFARESINNGATWSNTYALGIQAPNSTTTIINHKDVLIACHNRLYASNPSTQAARATLDLSISKDNGNNWARTVVLETSDTLAFFQPTLMVNGDSLFVFYGSFNNSLLRGGVTLQIFSVTSVISDPVDLILPLLKVAATLYQLNVDPSRLISLYLQDTGIDAGEISLGSATGSNSVFQPRLKTKASNGSAMGVLWDIEVGQDANTLDYSGGLVLNIVGPGGGPVSVINALRIQINGNDIFRILPNGNVQADGTFTSF